MLIQPLLDKLATMQLNGLRAGLAQQLQSPQYAELSFEERLGLLIDQEWTARQAAQFQRRLKAARLHQGATALDLDMAPSRGLDRARLLGLAQADWIRERQGVIVVGPTGAGKTFVACALGHSACRHGLSVRYERLARLLYATTLAHADGSYPKLLDALRRVDLLILDDWLRDPLSAAQARDVLEILDDRYGHRATLVATQVPVDDWHPRLGDPTLADAILDRLVHNAHRLHLQGESQRKARSSLVMSITSC
jgi:DNA replication protein DnaC